MTKLSISISYVSHALIILLIFARISMEKKTKKGHQIPCFNDKIFLFFLMICHDNKKKFYKNAAFTWKKFLLEKGKFGKVYDHWVFFLLVLTQLIQFWEKCAKKKETEIDEKTCRENTWTCNLFFFYIYDRIKLFILFRF